MERNLCKTVLARGGYITPLVVGANQSTGTGLMNPSVLIDGEDILVNIRNVNYTLYHSEGDQRFINRWGPLAYLNPENDIKLKTVNFLGKLNNDLTIKEVSKVDTSLLDSPTPKWEFHGLEDARLVKWDNKLYLSGVRRDTTDNGQGRMELSEVVDNKEVSRVRIEPPTEGSYCEKNWMPILDMPYHYVKWANPTEVVKVDIEKGTSETVFSGESTVPSVPDFRGGSQVITWGDNRICLVHQVNLFNNRLGQKDAVYLHRFIVWDKEWNIVRISEPFSFMTGQIEFCCGLAFHKDDVLITFGFQDNAAYLLSMPSTLLNTIIYE
jgi:hypothetical protein